MTDPRIVSEPRGGSEDATFARESLALFNVAARSGALIGGDRALEGGCWPGPLVPLHLG